MAFTCGFFNSQNGDRKYNAEQMASIFDGLIKDGVYDTVGDIFAVTPGTGMQVLVGSGRAWFDHTWNNNDAPYPLAITAADVSLPRYDAVVLETNHSDTVRTNRLRVLTGTPASNPVKPTMTSTANVKQHPLAYIRVTAGATAIKQSMIQVVVGTSECPFVTGIIDTAQIDALFQQWNGEFNEWFDNLKAQLSDNVVANLQGQIDQKVAKADVATTADIEAGTSTTKWVSPKGLKDFSKNVGVYDQTTGENIKLQTGVGLVGVEHHIPSVASIYPITASSIKPFWVHDKYIAYCGCKNIRTGSTSEYNAAISVINAETGSEYFSTNLTNLNASSQSRVFYNIDSVCNGKGFVITDMNTGWGATYDHEKKTLMLDGFLPSGVNRLYNKIGFTDNYKFRYDRYRASDSTVYYWPRNRIESAKSLTGNFKNESYGFIYAGYKGDSAYIAYVNRNFNNGRDQLSIYKFDFANKTVTKIVGSSDYILSNMNLRFTFIMTDDTSAYFVIEKEGTNIYSKILKFNYINETWNIGEVLNSQLLPFNSNNKVNYIGTVNNIGYMVCGSGTSTMYHFDKTNLQIYMESVLTDYGTTFKLITDNATSEVKFDKYIPIGNGYFDPSTMTHKLLTPSIMPSYVSSPGTAYGVLSNYDSGYYTYGSTVHEGIVTMPIFLYRPANNSIKDYPNEFFGKIQPVLLTNLA